MSDSSKMKPDVDVLTENTNKMIGWADKLSKEHQKNRRDDDRPLIRRASEIDLVPKFIPTGIGILDDALGGGIPQEAITVIHGTHFTGKTALALMVAATLTKNGENVLYVYTETPPPYHLFKQFGIALDKLWLVGPQDYAEQMIDAVENLLWDHNKKKPTGLVKLVIVDSYNNFVGKKEIEKLEKEGSAGENMAVRAKLLDNFLRRLMGRGLLEGTSSTQPTSAIFIGQNRANISGGPMSMVADTISGGYSVKYNPKVTIELRKKSLGPDKKFLGHTVKVNVSKNAIIGSPSSVEYTVMYGVGVDNTENILAKAIEFGYVVPDKDMGRGWIRIMLPVLGGNGDILIKGKTNLIPILRTLPEVVTILSNFIAQGKPKTPIEPGKIWRTIDNKDTEATMEPED